VEVRASSRRKRCRSSSSPRGCLTRKCSSPS
jgi:hypothetical protein